VTGIGARGVPELCLSGELAAFRDRARAFLRAEMDRMRLERRRDFFDLTGWDADAERELLARAGATGLVGVSLPVEYGGGGRPRSWQAVVSFEAAAHDAPLIDTAAVLVAPSVLGFGSDEQRTSFVPAAAAGTTTACIAYTEAGAGSDLARVATTAVDDGQGGFVLDGVKVLVTGAHKADWCCTIARTDPESSGTRGLSMFLVEMDTPGIVVERVPTANGWTLGTVRFERASVPGTALLGTRDDGWRQLGAALLGERSGTAWLGWASRNVQALVETCRGTDDALARDAVADLVTRLFVALRLSERVLTLQDEGVPSAVEAAMTKVCVTELLQRIARVGDGLLGPAVATERGWFGDRSLPAWFAYETVERLHPTVSVGANEVQRTTIGQLGLGLPAEPRPT
jgi:alkylation response protein AidB-like acyl-CoA dehydrogenase